MRRLFVLSVLLVSAVGEAKVPARPPDPRRGERLDGRDAPPSAHAPLAKAVPRLLLAVPRVALRAAATPVLFVTKEVEEHDWPGRIHRALTTEDGLIGVRPIAGYESGFGLGVGGRVFDRRHLGPGSLIEVRAATIPGDAYGLELSVRPDAARYGLKTRLDTNDSIRFYGIHGESASDLRERGRDVAIYSQDHAVTEVDVQFTPAPWARLALLGGADLRRFGDGETSAGQQPISEVFCGDCQMAVVDETEVPGFQEGTRRVIGGARLALDSRRTRFETGMALDIDGEWAHGFAGDPSHDLSLVSDGRAQLGVGDRAFVVRAKAGVVEPLGDAPVPFVHLMRLGGSDGVRGLTSQSFHSSSIALASLEYRFLIDPFMDAVLFTDYGGAFEQRFEGFSVADMHSSFGVGLRRYDIKISPWDSHLILSTDVAWAPGEGFRFGFSGVL